MTKYETLGKMMSYNDTLKVKCNCGHELSIPQKDAVSVFGADATPFDIRRRLRCSQCGELGKVEVWI